MVNGLFSCNGAVSSRRRTMVSKRFHVPTEATRSQVDAMAGYGVPEHSISAVLKINPKTLRKHYRDELDTAHIRANSAVAQSLFRKAIGDGPQSVTAAIFWAKTRMGWKDRDAAEYAEIGKKEEAKVAAKTAGHGTEWGEDLSSNVVPLRS
jgi:hypothetical protein